MSTVKGKFVVKHTFTDVAQMEKGKRYYGRKEKHFNIPWSIYIYKSLSTSDILVKLQCHELSEKNEYEINATIIIKMLTKTGEEVTELKEVFGSEKIKVLKNISQLEDYLIDGKSTLECHVTIHNMTGIDEPIFRSFDDESAKEFSDAVLVVEEQKFHVNKMYLAAHSTFFKSLFFENFEESKQSEVELKDIDPYDFQKFLEVLYAKPDINDDTVEGILKLSDMYDTEAPIQQCEKFLIKDSEKSLKEKFFMAIQYKLENLKKKCMPELKTSEDIASVIPEEAEQFNPKVWKELLNLSLDFNKKLTGK